MKVTTRTGAKNDGLSHYDVIGGYVHAIIRCTPFYFLRFLESQGAFK